MKSFAFKFLDITIGVVLGLGFQWWPNLQEPWQFIAFIYAYLAIIDYWIDTAAALKKYPPKRELDFMIDVAITFIFFLFIYSTQITILYFLTVFAVFRVLDSFWLLRAKNEYQIEHHDKLVVNTWLLFDIVQIVTTLLLILGVYLFQIYPIVSISAFVVTGLLIRAIESLRYKKVYFV